MEKLIKELRGFLALVAGTAIVLGVNCNGQDVTLSDRLRLEAARVDSILAQGNRSDGPGCSVSVSRGKQVVYEHSYGMASIELGVPLKPAIVFHAASVSKIFTAMSIMLLAQRGKLSVDDEVRKYIPELPEYGTPLTIRHLLSHTSGLRDVFELQGLGGYSSGGAGPNDQFVDILVRQRSLNFSPGTDYQYNNGGYILLAEVVKRVSGLSLRAFAQANIFEPLGMKSTFFHDEPTELIANRAEGYSPVDGKTHLAVRADPGGIVGNAGLFTTSQDLLLWAQNWDSGPFGSLLAKMAQPTVLTGGSKTNYGLGLEVGEYGGSQTVGHSGGNAGFVAKVIRYQGPKVAVAVLCNRDDVNVGQLANRVADVYLPSAATDAGKVETESPPSRVRLTLEELASKEGVYRNPSDEQLLRIFVRDGKLMANIVGRSEAWEMTSETPSQFTLLGGIVRLEFLADDERRVQRIRVQDGEAPKPSVIERVSPWIPSARDLPSFAGQFRSEELGITYTVVIKGSTVGAQIPGQADVILQPVIADTFAGNVVGVLKFSRDEQSRVSSFSVNTSGVHGLRFGRLATQPCLQK